MNRLRRDMRRCVRRLTYATPGTVRYEILLRYLSPVGWEQHCAKRGAA